MADNEEPGNADTLPIPGEQKDNRTISRLIKIHNVHLDGLRATKVDLIHPKIENVFQASTFEEVLKETYKSKASMDYLDIFQPVDVIVDAVSDGTNEPTELDVTFRVKELNRLSAQCKTEVGNQDNRLVLGGKIRNCFGRAEDLVGTIAYGTKKSTTLQLSFMKPLFGDKDKSLTSTVYQGSMEFLQSSFKEISRGFGFEYPIYTNFGVHSCHFDAVWREISCLSDRSSWEVRKESGHFMKVAIRHIVMKDTRDHNITPSSGHLIRLEQELAGFANLGNVKFHKFFLECQYNKTLPYKIMFTSSLNLGLLNSIGPSKISDRFFLGGPLSVRGFQLRGIGPHSDDDSIGGDAVWAASFRLMSPLPYRPLQGGFGERLRTHFFINIGNVGNIDRSKIRDSTSELLKGYRWSYGMGLLVKLSVAQLELNYCIPCRAQERDRVNHGFQFGIGLNFL